MVGVQLLQVGGTAVCVDWLSTFGIQTTQLTLQDENGIYTLINTFYFFVREKGETVGGEVASLTISVLVALLRSHGGG